MLLLLVLEPFFKNKKKRDGLDWETYPMCFGIRLFQKRQPSLIWILALCKIQGTRIGLVDFAIIFLRVDSLAILID